MNTQSYLKASAHYRCYTKVTDQQKEDLIRLLQSDPQMQVIEAAARTGIKYPRATAIYRSFKAKQAARQNVLSSITPSVVETDPMNCMISTLPTALNSGCLEDVIASFASMAPPAEPEKQFNHKPLNKKSASSCVTLRLFDANATLAKEARKEIRTEGQPLHSIFQKRLNKLATKQGLCYSQEGGSDQLRVDFSKALETVKEWKCDTTILSANDENRRVVPHLNDGDASDEFDDHRWLFKTPTVQEKSGLDMKLADNMT